MQQFYKYDASDIKPQCVAEIWLYFAYNGCHGVLRYSCRVFKPFACWYAAASEGYMSV
jgi:hypothetical protein